MNTPKICLNMIVKNESRIIQRCLTSVLSLLDYVVITDTGSSDNTIQLIEEFLSNHNIPGRVYQEPWSNFGYNRTNSIENAKSFLSEIQADMENTFLFFMDADMKIVIEPNFSKHHLTNIQVGQIIQKNSQLKYYNTRICRSDIPITCMGVTHEYYSISNSFHNTKIDTIWIDDIGDGGAKADKFTRDISLLEKGLEEEPRNERYHFYLAQSYNCVGQHEKSIEYYKKRIDLGGWHEEIYHSHLSIGNMYSDCLKDWSKALEHYLLSFQKSGGKRGEGLMKIVEYYKDKREYHSALIFLEKLFKLTYPKDDVLFIDYHVYTYKPLYEFSIIAYYLGLKYEGLLALQYLIFSKQSELPPQLKENCKNNMAFYINKLPTTSIKRIENIMLSQYYNPSSSSFVLTKPEENISEGVFRSVNYTINDSGHYLYPPHQNYIHTENYWVTMQDNKIISQHKIEVSPDVISDYKREYYGIQGLEDGRHIVYQNEIYTSYTSFEYGRDAKASMILSHMNKDTYQIDRIVSLKYEEDRIQKNWVPFEYQNQLCFVYSYEPFVILSVNPETGECQKIMEKYFEKYDLSELRGSAPPIWIPQHQCYLIMTHEVIFSTTRKYVHRFLMLDSEFNLLNMSEPFYFEHLFIEFSLSVMYHPETNDLIIPYSYKDGQSFVCTIPFNNIPWLPENIRKYFEYFR
jgi:glycosyltransferase involved in cell wall biosynthesis